jgi:hypothetical protein
MKTMACSSCNQAAMYPVGYARAPEFAGLRGLDWQDPTVRTAMLVLSATSGAACAFHGYKRNRSVGWAVAWGLLGGAFPIITPVIAVAQGFGKPASPGLRGLRGRKRRR